MKMGKVKNIRKYILSENTINCPSCGGSGTYSCSGENFDISSNAICFDCDGEGQVHDEFWQMEYVRHKHLDIKGWIVGFDGGKAIVEVVEDDEEKIFQLVTRLKYRVEELEHAEEE